MSKYRMTETTLSDGRVVYGIQKKGWFGWRDLQFVVWGNYYPYHHMKNLVQYKLDVLRENEATPISTKVLE